MITWDNAAVALAVVACLLRLADRPRAATITSSLSVLAATLGQWAARQARCRDRIGLRV
jgi:hypothetical protein